MQVGKEDVTFVVGLSLGIVAFFAIFFIAQIIRVWV